MHRNSWTDRDQDNRRYQVMNSKSKVLTDPRALRDQKYTTLRTCIAIQRCIKTVRCTEIRRLMDNQWCAETWRCTEIKRCADILGCTAICR